VKAWVRRLPALLVLALVGCAGQRQSELPRSGAVPRADEPMEASPVAFTEPQRVPAPSWVGTTSEPVVSLRTPFSRAEVAGLLDRYFEAIALESNTRLSELLADDATLHFSLQKPGSSALVSWVRRFAQYDYRTVHPESMYDPNEVEIYTAADVAAFGRPHDLAFVPEGDQLLARIRLTPGTLSNRFGDEMQLLLSSVGDELVIRRIYERGFSAR
jgi:hypothetical protein